MNGFLSLFPVLCTHLAVFVPKTGVISIPIDFNVIGVA